ncbi:hypothetical protein [Micromonospora aurantiaca (nom. illeg.)]|uniref:hypothetical protein n=1 Tax=Micromonospora aurantiaca (nom. illeg.) TaxID=47850 RepID=UPI0033F5DF49
MAAQTFWPVLVEALYAKWSADPDLRAAGWTVYDGPPDGSVSAGRRELFVGGSGEDYGDGEDAGSTEQDWANANTTERDSTEQVVCGLWWSQGGSMAEVRRGVAEALDVIAAGLRADVTVGGAVSFHAELVSVRWRQIRDANGVTFGAVFVVRAWSRVYM